MAANSKLLTSLEGLSPTYLANGTFKSQALAIVASLSSEDSPILSSSTRGYNTLQPIDEKVLIQEIVKIQLTKIRDLFGKYKIAITSAQGIEPCPLYFLIYCVIEMERIGEEIHGSSLFNKCVQLQDVLPENFIDRLTVRLREFRLPDFEDLASSEIFPTVPHDGQVSRENVTLGDETNLEDSGEDDVDGLSSTSTVNALLLGSLSDNSSLIPGSPEDLASTSVGAPSNKMSGERETRRTGSQKEASLIRQNTRVGGRVGAESEERTANSRIVEALLAVTNENKLLEDCKLCVKCHDKPRGITFLPCGHFTMCRECAGPTYICNLCQKSVLATVDTFLC
ncbi:unnamed protein product [Lymnaea stagnalis]|uniref:RING-type domain-containing protein n=1 Tax=Lymnaea stagnalis TaxID=6523 RepID=A0AAV2IAQ3_LYMST